MSKLGRYSADRKKVEAVTATKSIGAAQCGTIFTVTEAGTAIVLTLPTVGDAGAGWWCRFVLIANAGSTTNVTIDQSTSDTANIFLAQTNIDGANVQLAGDGVVFDTSESVNGDWGEIWTDGNKWYGNFFSSVASGLDQYDA